MPKSPDQTPTSGTEPSELSGVVTPTKTRYIGTKNLALSTPAPPTDEWKVVIAFAASKQGNGSVLAAYGDVLELSRRRKLSFVDLCNNSGISFLDLYELMVYPRPNIVGDTSK